MGYFFARFCPRNRGRNRCFCKGFAKGADFARAAGGGEGESGEEGVFRRFSVRIVPGGVHASATSPIGRVCSVEDDEGELGKKSACFTQ